MATGRADARASRRRRSAEFPLLGVPVRFDADPASALELIESAYGAWSALERWPELLPPSTVRPAVVRIVVRSAVAGRDPRVDRAPVAGGDGWPPEPRMDHRGRLVLRAPGIACYAGARRSEAWCRVAPALLDRPAFYLDLVSTLALWLVAWRDRQPVHGATVALGDRGLVLAASSGTGKSTLAYTAHRAGLRVVDDDVAYVQLDPRTRVWGRARRLHLPPDAAARFPELADYEASLRPNGKRRVAVPLPPPGDGGSAPAVAPVGLCLLERDGGRVALEPVDVDAAAAWVLDRLDGGFRAYRDTIGERVRVLAACGAWRLRLSDDPTEAVPVLRELLGARGS